MAQVDRSLRETIRRLHAMNAGGVSTRYSTKHVQISTNPFLMSFIRIAGLNRPLGVVYGRVQETQPTILLNLDPRNDESFEKFSLKFGKSFSEFLNDPKSYITIDYNPERDDDALGMAFDPKRADDRKEWVAII